ncbi:unnamed protein product [Ambrosiozyma monospora]|uniref:Unnamed protein product n=1 Tax=Ambrosiozyma monospora TaxID=43982 RepID=A0A9W6Z519_AMBMO|nr:unnamed protein product [Ambrosiozyma monospora]
MSRLGKIRHPPASSDDNNFKEALKQYENKQYKKSIKILDSVIKRNSNHAQSFTLKGLVLESSDLPEKDEAESYVQKGLKKNPKQPLACHIAGIYYRQVKNYAEASKWYQAALDNNSTNKGIWRDLSTMQSQIRDYKNLPKSRLEFLEEQSGYRCNWTGAALAHYLNGDYAAAEKVLTKIEDVIKGSLGESDMYEHSECHLLKNKIIADSGDYARALKDLDELVEGGEVRDGTALLEFRALYLEKLGRDQEASKIYRQLLKRNPDNVDYYHSLERTLGTLNKPAALRLALYEKLARFYPRSDPPKFIPLTFLKGDAFEKKLREYILGQLKRGVPATFVNVKPLYKRKSNIPVIFKIVNEFYNSEENSDPLIHTWTAYFLAQHYYRIHDYKNAIAIIDEAIHLTPTLVELYIVKARIYKRINQLEKASSIMEEARLMDLQDRFINYKSTKYFLRANNINAAVDTISLFTKNDETSNGVADLHTMQCIWFLTESADAYFRLYKSALQQIETVKKTPSETQAEELFNLNKDVVTYSGLALKRYGAVIETFGVYWDDQLDFHQYCLRKGTPRAYLDMLSWGDHVFHQPIYMKSLVGYSNVTFDILHNEEYFKEVLTARPVKKSKKEKKEEGKKRELLIKYARANVKDEDVLGETLVKKLVDMKNKDKLGELTKLITKSEYDLSIDSQILKFKLNFELKKFVLCLQSLNKIHAVNATHPSIGALYLKLHQELNDSNVQDAIKKILILGLTKNFGTLVKNENRELVIDELVKIYLKHDTFETGLYAIFANTVVACEKFTARLDAIQAALDPYESNYLEYYKL